MKLVLQNSSFGSEQEGAALDRNGEASGNMNGRGEGA